jgi:hypothetical protein
MVEICCLRRGPPSESIGWVNLFHVNFPQHDRFTPSTFSIPKDREDLDTPASDVAESSVTRQARSEGCRCGTVLGRLGAALPDDAYFAFVVGYSPGIIAVLSFLGSDEGHHTGRLLWIGNGAGSDADFGACRWTVVV